MSEEELYASNGNVFTKYELIDDYEKKIQENSRLKERIEYLERSNNRREETIIEQTHELVEIDEYKERIEKIINILMNLEVYRDLDNDCDCVVVDLNKTIEILKGDRE